MKVRRRSLIAMGLAAILAVGAVAAVAAWGRDSTRPAQLSSSSEGAGSPNADSADPVGRLAATLGIDASRIDAALGGQRAIGPEFIDRLAQALGIDPQKLRDAIKQTATQMVSEAEQRGDITKEMADRLRSLINNSNFEFFNGFPPIGRGPLSGRDAGGAFGMREQTLKAVADYLGMTSDQLRSDLASGKTLTAVGQAHGKSRDDLKAVLTDRGKLNIDQDLKDGTITQQQADDLKSKLGDTVDRVLDTQFRGFEGEHGFRNGPGGAPGGGRSDRQKGPPPQQTPVPSGMNSTAY